MRILVQALLWLFPGSFRRQFGADLLVTFDEQWRSDPGCRLALRTCLDLLRGALLERSHREGVRLARPEKGDRFMIALWQDLRFAVRTLSKSPGFTLSAIATLALGIGANTAIYSVVDAVLLKGLPYPDADRLVFITESLPNASYLNASWPDYQDWRAQSRSFSALAAFQPNRVRYMADRGAQSVPAAWITGSFFPLLGARTILGRTFDPDRERAAVVTYSFWRKELHADPQIVGKALDLDYGALPVAGVLAPEFSFQPFAMDVFLPLAVRLHEPALISRDNHPGLIAIGSLQSGVSLSRASADMRTIMDRLARSYPESNRNETALLTPFAERLIGHFRSDLLILLGAVSFVLLIACANVAHLALARAAGRHREFAIRTAIGAGRGRLMRQLFVESTVLALAGAAAGLLAAAFSLPALLALYPDEIPGLRDTHIDIAVLLYTLGISLLASILFGLAPMLASIRRTAARPRSRFRSLLFAGEIAAAVVLTVGAALLLRSFVKILHMDPGFQADHLLALDMVHSGNVTPAAQARFFGGAAERIAHLPSVISAAAAMCPPLSGACWTSPYAILGVPAPPVMQRPWTALNMVLPGYFETMRIRLVAGRGFTAHDEGSAGYVAIVNQTMARAIAPRSDVLGSRIDVAFATGGVLQVIGVVADVKQFGLDSPAMPEVFVPAAQMPVNFMTIVARTRQDPASLARAAADAIQSLDKTQPVARVIPMTAAIGASLARRKFGALLLGLFSILAVVLAAVGVAGVMSYGVAQRTREFGIRMAMGAQRSGILRLVIGQGLRLAAIGVATGSAAAWGLSRLLTRMLFQVQPHDPAIYAGVAATMAAVAAAACWWPARRAARIQPAAALRHD